MTKFPLVAKKNNVIIKQIEADEKMYGNILIPDTGKEKPLMGEVLSVGPGIISFQTGTRIPLETSVGDIVFFPSFGGTRITYLGEEYIVCKEDDLLADLKEEKKIEVNQEAIKEILAETEKSFNQSPVDKIAFRATQNFNEK